MSYTVGSGPAPLTFTIYPKLDSQILLSSAWICFAGYRIYILGWQAIRSDNVVDLAFLGVVSLAALLCLIRRERIEIYADQMVWRKTYFGVTRSSVAPLNDVLGAEWCEGEQHRGSGKRPDCVEFYLPDRSIKARYGFTFDDFDRMREEIRLMFPDVINRWGRSRVRSKDLTLLNLN